MTLKKDHETLKESYAAKLKAIAPVLKGTPCTNEKSFVRGPGRKSYGPGGVRKQGATNQHTYQNTQLYTIIAKCSSVTLDDGGILLALSESNEKCGHHYITLALPGQPKFKLEWEDVTTDWQQVYRFKLYSVIEDPVIGGIHFTVTVDHQTGRRGQTQNSNTITEICCGEPLGNVDASSDESLQSLGTGTLDLNLYQPETQIRIQFIHHRPNFLCSCPNPQCKCKCCLVQNILGPFDPFQAPPTFSQ